MKTNKIPLPDFVGNYATGSVNVSMQFEQAPVINYTIFVAKNETIDSSKYKTGITKFTSLNHVFKLNNSNLKIDPLSGKEILSASFTGYRPVTYTEEEYKQKLEKDENVFEVVDIGNKSASIASDEIVSLEVNYATNNSDDWTFTPVSLTWGDSEYDDNDDSNPYTNIPIYEPVKYTESVVINDPENASICPVTGLIKDFTMNCDVSGPTKIREINYYEGTILKKKDVYKYGFTYVSDDVGVAEMIAENNSNTFKFDSAYYANFWGLVEYYTINYNYEDGYYLGYDKQGARKVRYAPEQNFEVLDLMLNFVPPKTADPVSANAFRFFWTPIVEFERLELQAYYNFYKDAKPTFDDQYFWVEAFAPEVNKWIWTKVKKEDYVLPMFVKKQLTYSRCFSYTYIDENHELNESKQIGKVLMTGHENKVIKEVTINESDSTQLKEYYAGNGLEDSYEVLTEVITSQDSDFKNFTQETTSESNFGRPGQADYYPLFQQQEKEQNLNNTKPKDPFTYVVKKVNTTGEPQSSVNIQDAKSAEDAFNKYQQQLRKQMLFQGDEFIVTCLYDPTIKPNYLLTCTYKGKSYKGIVKSVDHNLEVLGKNVGKGYTNITVAIENVKNKMWTKLTMEKTKSNSDKDPPPVSLPEPNTRGNVADVATLVESIPTRGNY